jgi:hypothetical protein
MTSSGFQNSESAGKRLFKERMKTNLSFRRTQSPSVVAGHNLWVTST